MSFVILRDGDQVSFRVSKQNISGKVQYQRWDQIEHKYEMCSKDDDGARRRVLRDVQTKYETKTLDFCYSLEKQFQEALEKIKGMGLSIEEVLFTVKRTRNENGRVNYDLTYCLDRGTETSLGQGEGIKDTIKSSAGIKTTEDLFEL